MNKKTEALMLAEEALNAMLTHMGMDEDEWTKPTFNQAREALSAIREALADAFAASVKPIAEQEPVGEVVSYHQAGLYDELPIGTKLYASPVRTKDLTGQDLCDLEVSVDWKGDSHEFEAIVKAAIAKYKEKNK